MTTKTIKIKAAREGGQVARFHALPNIPPYNVAEHTYGVTSLLLLLHPNPSLNLIKAVHFHDLPERWLGDIPATAKWNNPELAVAYKLAEERVFNRLGFTEYAKLTKTEQVWLNACDTLELLQWCDEVIETGNTAVVDCAAACRNTLDSMKNELPSEFLSYYQQYKKTIHNRLSDRIEDIE